MTHDEFIRRLNELGLPDPLQQKYATDSAEFLAETCAATREEARQIVVHTIEAFGLKPKKEI